MHKLIETISDVQWYTNAQFGKGHGNPTLTSWKCFGNESSLANCLYSTTSYCYHINDVGVSCQGQEIKGYLNTLSLALIYLEFLMLI